LSRPVTGGPWLEATAAGGKFLLLPVAKIQSAPQETRLVYEHVEDLAASIAGTGDKSGVGILSPILVRMSGDGVYHVIDGERRLRACRLIAERASSCDMTIPALVFAVSERVAMLMRLSNGLDLLGDFEWRVDALTRSQAVPRGDLA
jgi:ParB family chromosome partitioning protein